MRCHYSIKKTRAKSVLENRVFGQIKKFRAYNTEYIHLNKNNLFVKHLYRKLPVLYSTGPVKVTPLLYTQILRRVVIFRQI